MPLISALTQKAEAGRSPDFKFSLVYTASFKTGIGAGRTCLKKNIVVVVVVVVAVVVVVVVVVIKEI